MQIARFQLSHGVTASENPFSGLRVAAGPYQPNGAITQLSPSLETAVEKCKLWIKTYLWYRVNFVVKYSALNEN